MKIVEGGSTFTSLLAVEFDGRGRIAFGRFYARRAWRLWPPLLAVIVLASALPPFSRIAPAGRWKSDLVAGTYLSDWWSHIDSHHTLGYLSHTWSLAVEEQFYLVWPVLLVVLLRRRLNPWWLLAPITGLVVLRFAEDLFNARFDGLIIGALVALLVRGSRVPVWVSARSVAWVGASVVLGGMLVTDAANSVGVGAHVGITLAGIGTALVLANLAVRRDSIADRVLSVRPFVEIGKLSYTIYLVHYPIFLWVDSKHFSRAETTALELALTVPAVIVCWLLVEKPARRMKARWSTVAASDAVAASSPDRVSLSAASSIG